MPTIEVTEVEINDLRAANSMRSVDRAAYNAWLAKHAPPAAVGIPKHASQMTPAERTAMLKARGITQGHR